MAVVDDVSGCALGRLRGSTAARESENGHAAEEGFDPVIMDTQVEPMADEP
jgi:hypothetical protein